MVSSRAIPPRCSLVQDIVVLLHQPHRLKLVGKQPYPVCVAGLRRSDSSARYIDIKVGMHVWYLVLRCQKPYTLGER